MFNRSLFQILTTVVMGGSLLLSASYAQAQTRTENFDTGLGAWTGFRNTLPGHQIQWVNTGRAGRTEPFDDNGNNGDPGAIEGNFPFVGLASYGYVADIDLGGSFSITDPFSASGKLWFGLRGGATAAVVGFFESADPAASQSANILGLEIREPWRWQARYYDGGADPRAPQGPVGESGPTFATAGEETFDFTVDWDPTGGAAANQGRLDVSLSNANIDPNTGLPKHFTAFLDQIPTDTGLTFDSFGIIQVPCCGDFAATGTLGIDSVTYSLPAALADADFDGNGIVDGADLAAWQLGFGIAGSAARQDGDSDGDLDADGRDFLNWQQQLDVVSGGGASSAVPEPTTLGLTAALAGIGIGYSLSRKRKMEDVPMTC